MSHVSNVCLVVIFVSSVLCVTTRGIAQDDSYKEAVGYNALVAEKGAALEDGTGIRVVQPEAFSLGYLPRISDPEFTEKTILDGTGTATPGQFSGHATTVGKFFYGRTTSMTPGISSITGYTASDYIGRVLNFNGRGDPLPQGFDVGNHSYIVNVGTGTETASATAEKLQRFDFVINRDNTVMVVGANNGSRNLTPPLMASSYNAITVGRSDGMHSHSTTPFYGLGRNKPDIVAPADSTSNSTPIVASAAALLRAAGNRVGDNHAIQNEVIKSTLFAGATKDEFANWSRSVTQPIDDVFGYGELNILNSYHIFEGGEFDGSNSNPATDVGLMGWDYGDFAGGNAQQLYDFKIGAGQTAELSASLVWNIDVIDTAPNDVNVFTPTTSLANLDLELFDSSGSYMNLLIDSSRSTLYNTEHIYLTELAAGDYTFRVSGDLAHDYGFSWRINTTFSAIPEPNTAGLFAVGLFGLLLKRRRSV